MTLKSKVTVTNPLKSDSQTLLTIFDGGCSYLAHWLFIVRLQRMLTMANITLESKVRVR